MFDDFDFSVLDDPDYKEDAVREDLIAPLLRALGYQPTGKHRMQRSQSLLHPFVMIGSQRRKISIIPDYTLFSDSQAVLVIDAKSPSAILVNSAHVEQAFSYAIHPDIRTKSYALCNGRELVLYDIDRSGPVFRVNMAELKNKWPEVLKHFSPEALVSHQHREFRPDLGVFLKNAGFDQIHNITFDGARISSLAHTQGGVLTASASPEMIDGIVFQGSFDMPMRELSKIIGCLPLPAIKMVQNSLATPCSLVWVGGVIKITWTVRLGEEELGLYRHDPLIPLVVTEIHSISHVEPFDDQPDDVPSQILNLKTVLQYL